METTPGTRQDVVLVGYTLSDRFRRDLETMIDAKPRYLGIPELRRMPIMKMVGKLLRLRAKNLFLVFENDASEQLLPILSCFAALIPRTKIAVVHPDLRCESISRWQTFFSLGSVLGASLRGLASLRRCRKQLALLHNLPRVVVKKRTPGAVLYFKSNLWVGVAAGGSVGHIAGVVNGLADKGLALEFIGLEPPLRPRPSVRFHPVSAPKTYGVPYDLNLFRFAETFEKQVTRLRFHDTVSWIYQRLSLANYAGVKFSRKLEVPLVLEYNGSEVWAEANWGKAHGRQHVHALAEAVCLRHAHVVVTVSEVLRDELVARGVEAHRIVCYPNCIDPSIFDPSRIPHEKLERLRDQHGIPPDAVVVGFVGTFGPWHGMEVLAEAIRRLAVVESTWLERFRVHFLIVGDGPEMAKVRDLLSDEVCKPFYTLTGLVPQSEAANYLALADILVCPHVPNRDGSRFFGSPTKLFEYMAMGKAIVGSDLEQIGQVLARSLRTDQLPGVGPTGRDNELGLLSPPGRAAELIKGIRFLVEQRPWREVLGKNARKEALSRYTWDQHVGAILERLRETCPP
jgi:glycosyltransferase involved in cell wall biosynthesis